VRALLTTAEDEEEDDPGAKPRLQRRTRTNGWEIGYQRFTINGMLVMASRCGRRRTTRVVPLPECQRTRHSACAPRSPIPGVAWTATRCRAHNWSMCSNSERGAHRRRRGNEEPRSLDSGTPKDDDRKNGWASWWNTPTRAGRRARSSREEGVGLHIFGEAERPRNPTRRSPWCLGRSSRYGRFQPLDHQRQSYDEAEPRKLYRGRRYAWFR